MSCSQSPWLAAVSRSFCTSSSVLFWNSSVRSGLATVLKMTSCSTSRPVPTVEDVEALRTRAPRLLEAAGLMLRIFTPW